VGLGWETENEISLLPEKFLSLTGLSTFPVVLSLGFRQILNMDKAPAGTP